MRPSKLYILSVIVISFIFDYASAQDKSTYLPLDSTQNRHYRAIYVELLGSSGLGASLNIDMRFNHSRKGWGFRAGVAEPNQQGRTTTYLFPILINRVNSLRRVALETGIGFSVTYRRWSYEDFNNIIHYNQSVEYPAVANVGVRFQPIKTGIVWRLYWAPTWRITPPYQRFTSWLGTSIGIGF